LRGSWRTTRGAPHLDATNRQVDVVEEGIELAVRVRLPPLEDSGLQVRPLGKSQMVLGVQPLVHCPAWQARFSRRLEQAADAQHGQAGQQAFVAVRRGDGKEVEVQHTPRLATDDLATLRTAALEGSASPCFRIR
jgi:DNA-binding transcriptional LysR family regulator